MTWEHKLAACAFGAAIGLALGMDARAGEASTQSARPWAIAQCDRLTGRRASAVFNVTVWSGAGWPVWRVVCLY